MRMGWMMMAAFMGEIVMRMVDRSPGLRFSCSSTPAIEEANFKVESVVPWIYSNGIFPDIVSCRDRCIGFFSQTQAIIEGAP
jgi:hypothetical protein